MTSTQELKIYALGGRRVVYARWEGREVQAAGLDRLELERHADVGEAQAALNDCPPLTHPVGPRESHATDEDPPGA